MIVYYTRYKVKESLTIESMLTLAFNCVSGMKNAPDSFKHLEWNGSESLEIKEGRNVLVYEIENRNIAFRVAIVDQNDEIWTTDLVLAEEKNEIQLRLAREKKIVSAEYDRNFNIPFIFKQLIRNGYGGNDYNLPVSDIPIYLDESNIDIVCNLINGQRPYSLPVIYVSHPFLGDEYEIDVNEFAKDMAGCAHVIVERSSSTSSIIKERTDSKNAYNGAIDIFYSDDSFRYLRSQGISINQYRYKITRAVYTRMAMCNIDDDISLSAIKLRNKIKKLGANNIEVQKLSLELDELRERRKEDNEFIDMLSEEIKKLEKKINDLENERYEANGKLEALTLALNQKANYNDNNSTVTLDYTEKQFYEDEIKRIILESIRQTISTYGDEEKLRRDYHILADIITNNTASNIGNEIKAQILSIIKKGKLSKTDVNALRGLGFSVHKGGHDKYEFHEDGRYIVTISNSPSDYKTGENTAHEAIRLIFGRT